MFRVKGVGYNFQKQLKVGGTFFFDGKGRGVQFSPCVFSSQK